MKLSDMQDQGEGTKSSGSGTPTPAGHNGLCTKGHERKCRIAKSDPNECECACGGENHGAGLTGQRELTEVEGVTHQICEHMFEDRDPDHENYSMTEFDLFTAPWGQKYIGRDDVALSIRKNHEKDRYEIFDYTVDKPDHKNYSDEAVYEAASTIEDLIAKVNRFMGRELVSYGHDNIDCRIERGKA